MSSDLRAETTASATPTRARATTYRRRRLLAAVALFAATWLALSGCRAVLDWAAGASSEGGGAAESTPGTWTGGELARSAPACRSDEELYGTADDPVPADLAAEIDGLLGHDAIARSEVSMSVWVQGWGEVVAHDPDLELRPASNQKILVAIGALTLLDPDARLPTRLAATAAPSDGVIDGDLVLVGGGDPTLWDVGPHSLYALGAGLRDQGVHRVTGRLWVDESRYDRLRIAQGWTDRQIPGDAAPISALTVAANRIDDSYAYLADPAAGNAEVFARYLAELGVTVDGGVGGTLEEDLAASHELLTLESPPISALVDSMLRNSDNTAAELLVKEIDRAVGGPGSTLGGLAASRAVVERWCLDVGGYDDDGSGLSYANLRSARAWRQMLQVARHEPWWPLLLDGLPTAGEPGGTLGTRLGGDATAGNLRAKTGTINIARGLTGTFTTAGGRDATFSVIINHPDDPVAATGPTDRILEAIAAHAG
jgi:serine-type D-Ala-D-Ala carboxypeptidase/endopeptidase (penicillin-binding protein 4)